MRVVHCKKERYDVYIGRPSKWGNPYTHILRRTEAEFIVKNPEEAIKAYRNWIEKGKGSHLLEDLWELKNKTLGCWCSPKPCHGDVLIKLVKEYL